ncbi:hypothetical protein RG963_13765 [Methanosarcina sp. Z-7115]|uniref:SMODS-associated and fused to various effectors domain-containing protein n=1 Tax=Methanosarcina baikalica TaxID=3073890 RepID=A0ABU2D4A4_9EURY|nr:hypothetical protein [Methanosarcina sp. Z-7115]MDR7666824.1 hypothetical protein [Methanosarcina sp. Z-7115]
MVEKEVWIGLFIFGLFSMLADTAGDFGHNRLAAFFRIIGMSLFVLSFVGDYMLRWMEKSLLIPIMFTEEMDNNTSHNMYETFVRSDRKLNNGSKLLEKIPSMKFKDPVISLGKFNPRKSHNPEDWILAWDELLKEWDSGIDRKLMERPLSNEGCSYHIFPHVALPLAFALGASVNLRRPLALYHYQSFDNKFYKVLDLKDPREVIYERDPSVPIVPPKTIPENLNLDGGKKLILHIIISARHIENFHLHEDYLNATNVAIVYPTDLSPKDNWLPYVQEIVQRAKPLIHRYEDVEVCLICPSVIAFALGMAFSRKGSLKVCHYFSDGKYRPVFPLSKIESHPPFS